MKPFSVVFVLAAALLDVTVGGSTPEAADSGSKSDLKSRLGSGLGSFHSLGGVNFDLVKYVLSGIQSGASDTLVAVPTQVGRAGTFGLNGLNSNPALVPGYQFRPPVPPYPVPFPTDGPYKGGGYRGVKALPIAPVGGGESHLR